MPSIRGVARLTDTAVNCISNSLLQTLLNIEDARTVEEGDWKPLQDSDIKDVVEYLDELNFHITDSVFKTVLKLYGERVKQMFSLSLINNGKVITRPPQLFSVLQIICKKSSINVDLTALTKISKTMAYELFDTFHKALSYLIPKMENLKELNLANVNNKECLPQIKNDHVKLVGQNCPNLENLNINHHKNITWDGVAYLGESQNVHIKSGCFKLKVLQIFDTCVFASDVAKLIVQLPNLRFLGYKEAGRVIKSLNYLEKPPKLKLTHVDNRGSKNRSLNYPTLRCKRTTLNALTKLCPGLTNLKARVSDNDVAGLVRLENVRSLELVYHVGKILSPDVGTEAFLRARGNNLTSLTIYCQFITAPNLQSIAECCTNLEQLWLRSNNYQSNSESEHDLQKKHNYLTHLRTLYMRIGLNESTFEVNIPQNVIPFLTKNGPLKELIIGVRSSLLTDEFVCNLLRSHNMVDIEKVLFMVPGVNTSDIKLPLTEVTVDYILANCEKIKKVGNLHVWDVRHLYKRDLHAKVKDQNWDLDVVDGKMILR